MNFFSFCIQEKERKQEKKKRKKKSFENWKKWIHCSRLKWNVGGQIEFEKIYIKVKNIVKN